jgi:hypothetical protein
MNNYLPAGITCTAKPVLNSHEQTLYNLCEEYFYLSQRKSNRCPVLSQVRLPDVIDISAPVINNIQANAMSFDIVIADSKANPLCIFEADGAYHNPNNTRSMSDQQKAEVAKQVLRDRLKDAITEKAGVPLFRLEVDGVHPHLDVVRAEAAIKDFKRDQMYRRPEGMRQYTQASHPDSLRILELEDIEIRLIRAGFRFPPGWEFVTDFELRH